MRGDFGGGNSRDGVSAGTAVRSSFGPIGAMRTLPLGRRTGYLLEASTTKSQNQPQKGLRGPIRKPRACPPAWERPMHAIIRWIIAERFPIIIARHPRP